MEHGGFRFWTWLDRILKLLLVLAIIGGAGFVLAGGDIGSVLPSGGPQTSVSPDVDGVQSVELEQHTLRVKTTESDYEGVRVIAPDGTTDHYLAMDGKTYTTNRVDSWPAGNYTVQAVGVGINGGYDVFEEETVYLVPAEN